MIEANNISITYKKSGTILKDISFYIKSGEMVFITGKSGSGKSSLLKTLYGEIPIASGSLMVNGIEMRDIRSDLKISLRRKTGVVFQDYQLINEWNIFDNIKLPLDILKSYSKDVVNKHINTLLNRVKLSHKQFRFPEELSGGEQQRAAVARALAHSPLLLLADEPTGNLDDYSTELVMDLFKEINRLGRTVIIVTHRMPHNMGLNYRQFHIDNGTLNEIH